VSFLRQKTLYLIFSQLRQHFVTIGAQKESSDLCNILEQKKSRGTIHLYNMLFLGAPMHNEINSATEYLQYTEVRSSQI
jgi:hypothetical protein